MPRTPEEARRDAIALVFAVGRLDSQAANAITAEYQAEDFQNVAIAFAALIIRLKPVIEAGTGQTLEKVLETLAWHLAAEEAAGPDVT